MKYNNMIVTFWFDEINNPKEYQEKFEENLSNYFSPLNTIGMPANINPVIPRLTAVTHAGHGNFSMSKVNVQFATNFDEKYHKSFDTCFEYVKERAQSIFSILTDKCKIKILYMAIHVNSEFESKTPVKTISTELFSEKVNGLPLTEIGVRLSQVLKEKYYVIMSMNDAKIVSYTKTFEPKDNTVQNIILPLISQKKVVIDRTVIAFGNEINDKYCFDTKEDYSTTKEALNEIFDICSANIKEISNNVENGKLI